MYYKTLGGRNTTSVHSQCPLYINQYTDCSMRVKPAYPLETRPFYAFMTYQY